MMPAKTFCKALKFAAHAAGVKDIRYYLNGVRLEWRDDRLTFVATDGSRLAHVVARTQVMGPPDPVEMTVTNADVKRLLSTLSKDKGDVVLAITNAVKDTPASGVVMGAGLSIPLTCTGGRYPDWRRVVPPAHRPSGTMPLGLSAQLMADACVSLAALDGGKWPGVTIEPGTPSEAVRVKPCKPPLDADLLDPFVIIMPMIP